MRYLSFSCTHFSLKNGFYGTSAEKLLFPLNYVLFIFCPLRKIPNFCGIHKLNFLRNTETFSCFMFYQEKTAHYFHPKCNQPKRNALQRKWQIVKTNDIQRYAPDILNKRNFQCRFTSKNNFILRLKYLQELLPALQKIREAQTHDKR